jgi:hypothetical protein
MSYAGPKEECGAQKGSEGGRESSPPIPMGVFLPYQTLVVVQGILHEMRAWGSCQLPVDSHTVLMRYLDRMPVNLKGPPLRSVDNAVFPLVEGEAILEALDRVKKARAKGASAEKDLLASTEHLSRSLKAAVSP